MYADDGSRVAELKREDPDFFEEPRNLLLGVCGDGVSPFDKPTKALSMMCFVFNIFNLPQIVRDQYENLQLWGVFQGKHSLHGAVHGILVEDLKVTWHGVEVFDSAREATFKLRAIPFCFIADLSGLYDFVNLKGIGALSGCSKCRYQGIHCDALRCRVYVDSQQIIQPVERTHKGMIADVLRAVVSMALPIFCIRLPLSNAYPICWPINGLIIIIIHLATLKRDGVRMQ
jgi:hypothetical protein